MAFFSRLLLFAIFSAVFLAGIPGPGCGFAAGPDDEQIRKIESRLSQDRKKLHAFDAREKDILETLSELEREVAGKRSSIARLERRIRSEKTEIRRLNRTLGDLEKSLKRTEARLVRKLVTLYRYVRRGYYRTLLEVDSLDDFRRMARYLGIIMREDRETLADLARQQAAWRRRILLTKKALAGKEAVREEEERRLASLREDLEKKVIRLMRVHQEKKFYETGVRELQVAASNLKQTLLDIEKKTAYRQMGSSRFEKFRGRLPYPLEGKIVSGDRVPGAERLKPYKGIFIEGGFGADVRTIFPGRVDFSGRIKGYGDVVIINHGSRFFSISAHLLERKRREGDLLGKGVVIGRVGDAAGSKRGTLYFEIRRGGKALNPLKWLKRR